MNNNWPFPPFYQIKNTGNVLSNDYEYFNNPELYPNFQQEFIEFQQLILKLKNSTDPVSILRYGDGDHFVLTKKEIGSATPGRRALGVSYSELKNHQEFIEGVLKNDYISAEIFPTARNYFKELYPDRKIDFPLEFIYGVIANKWLFNVLKDKKVGIIGASEKLYLIKELMEYKEYKEYLGINGFTDYIHFPQKYACDDIELVEEFVANQLKSSTSDIFLLGIGHAKLALLHRFKKYRNVAFIDVGCGIDAIAGCINITRPYFFDWINYRIEGYNYSDIDYLNYHGLGQHIILK
jgi:hypothetical protein